ncbi:protein indeterminate-domain 14-like [Prosopis cineraria]|uniref:protein indeterminate-domain 14-like n=1 Tax=Prosopis cineraria TaxID=364024 RepID=UPI0024104233|nr:protein indeterminate-domain 14-like [Prosopis cineraria]
MEESGHKELQLLPSSLMASSDSPFLQFRSALSTSSSSSSSTEGAPRTPSLDLQLSISLRPIQPPPDCEYKCGDSGSGLSVEAMKWQSAEQIRLAAMEKAYAERVRELTRREIEMAQSEFTRARHVWERAREEVQRAERMKERATVNHIGSSCMEITCQSCRRRFRP